MSENLTFTLSIPPTFVTKIMNECAQLKKVKQELLIKDLGQWLEKVVTFYGTGATEEPSTTEQSSTTEPTQEDTPKEEAKPTPGGMFKKFFEQVVSQNPTTANYTTELSGVMNLLDDTFYQHYGKDLDKVSDLFSVFCGSTTSNPQPTPESSKPSTTTTQ